MIVRVRPVRGDGDLLDSAMFFDYRSPATIAAASSSRDTESFAYIFHTSQPRAHSLISLLVLRWTMTWTLRVKSELNNG